MYAPVLSIRGPFSSINLTYSSSGLPMHTVIVSIVARSASTSGTLRALLGVVGICDNGTGSEPNINVHVRSLLIVTEKVTSAAKGSLIHCTV